MLLVEIELWSVSLASVKLAILFQYMKVFVPIRQGKLYWIVTIMIWTNGLFYFITALMNVVQCIPTQKIWDPTMPGVCYYNIEYLYLSVAIWSIPSDFSILVLPMYSIWRIRMPISSKGQFSALFAFASFACVCSVIRLIVICQPLPDGGDEAYKVEVLFFTGLLEVAIGLLCASLPFLPRFLKQTLGKKIQSSYKLHREDFPKRRNLPNTGSHRTLKSFAPWFRFQESLVDKVGDAFIPSERPSLPLDNKDAITDWTPQSCAIAQQNQEKVFEAGVPV
ncbi:MAG: hypothetical protein MMC33_003257 [Icmadophila ericetorum]|nr:hypothetical protein [Icmadophila ericetorum]